MSQVDQHASLSDKAQARFDALVDQAAIGHAQDGASRPNSGESGELAELHELHELHELQWIRAIVRQEAKMRGDDLPAATFDRLWQQTLPQLAKRPSESRATEAQGWRDAFAAWLSPWRLGWSLAGATAMVVAVVMARSPSIATLGTTPTGVAKRADESALAASDPAPTHMQVAIRNDGPSDGASVPAVSALPSATLAQAPAEIDPSQRDAMVEAPEAKVERIEFGGRSGRISHIDSGRGVTTVIWLSDAEAEPQKVQDL